MKKIFFMFLFISTLFTPIYVKKIATFPGLLIPSSIQVDDSRIYITEGSGIFVYSLKNFSLIKKFGNSGEGPEEFKGEPRLQVQSDRILVNSLSKVSFYTKSGTFIREVSNISTGQNFLALDNGYLGYHSSVEKEGIRFSGIYLYDSEFRRKKKVYQHESIAQSEVGKGWHLFARTYLKPLVCDNKIVSAGSADFIIDVFDQKGKKLFTISRDYPKVEFSESHRNKILNLYKTRPATAPEYEWWKKNIHFPAFFPAIREIFTSGKIIYVRTYWEKDNLSEFFVFDSRGTHLKRVFLPIASSNAKNAYPYMSDSSPFAIKNGKLYQLILDEETDEWSLDVHGI